MFQLKGKEINVILGAQTILIWTYADLTKLDLCLYVPGIHVSFFLQILVSFSYDHEVFF